jgi:DNA topoisomerase I
LGQRIKSLVIPPAWSAVWISPDPLGHLQVTGRDQRGRKQYRYHPRWRVIRDEAKYGNMLMFARALPSIHGSTLISAVTVCQPSGCWPRLSAS